MSGEALLHGACLGFAAGALMAGLLRACAAHFPAMGRHFWRVVTLGTAGIVSCLGAFTLIQAQTSGASGHLLASRRAGAAGILVAAAILALSGWRARAPSTRQPPRSLASSSGVLGLLLIVLAPLGFVAGAAGMPGGNWISAAAIAGYLVLVVVEIRRGQGSFDRVRARLADARPWPLPRRPDSSGDGTNPYEDDRATGRWGDAQIWVALVHGGATLKVALPRWPTGLAAEPGRRTGGPTTGDPVFDGAVGLVGDPDAWRPTLTAEVRGLLVDLVGRREGHLDPAARTLELLLPEAEARHLDVILDRMAALAAALPNGGGSAGLAARVADEPIAAVRRGHYEWLATRREVGPSVLRAAAADPDPEIAAWARSQLPPDGGAYR